MGTVAVQTQCCLKTDDESDNEDGVAHEEGTAVQIVDALRFSKPAANAGRFDASPVLPRAPSEASTIFVP